MKPTSKRAQATIAKQIAECCDEIKSYLRAIQRDFQWIKDAEEESEHERIQYWMGKAQEDISSLEANIANLKGLDPSNPLIEVASKKLEKFQSKISEVEESNTNNSSMGFWIVMAIFFGISLIGYIMTEH